MSVEIFEIRDIPNQIESVIALADLNKERLGFFSRGAFTQYASRNNVLVAVDDDNLIGYLLYRTTKNEAKIVHLCVDTTSRTQGVGRKLINKMKELCKHFLGISLLCRRDFIDASNFWEKIGFVPIGEKPGRGKKDRELTKWYFDNDHPSIFSHIATTESESKLLVVIDTCIFIALNDPSDENYQEAQALHADWLDDEIKICLTLEFYNDINRANLKSRREKLRDLGEKLLLHEARSDLDKLVPELNKLWPTRHLAAASGRSDLRHIAGAISGGAHSFLTWDAEILELASFIEDAFGLHVLTPTDFIVRLDEIRRESLYQPARFVGSLTLKRRRVQSGELPSLSEAFLSTSEGEKKTQFKTRVTALLNAPASASCEIVEDEKAGFLAVVGYRRQNPSEIQVTLLRTKNHKLGPTLIRRLLSEIISKERSDTACIIKLSDPYNRLQINSAAEELGFVRRHDAHIKIVLESIGGVNKTCQAVENFASKEESYAQAIAEIDLINGITSAVETGSRSDVSRIEHAIWPAKILAAQIPCFLVSIKPFWAMHLFDEDQSHQELFRAKDELAMMLENVYYRSRKNSGRIKAPARILWYVTREKSRQNTGCLRACSRLTEVLEGKPKSLYSRFKRLGIYEWKNISRIAKEPAKEDIMALRFDDTELFPNPVYHDELKRTLDGLECKFNLQSPSLLSEEAFEKLYKLATTIDQ